MTSKNISAMDKLNAPMPGNILDILFSKGDKVSEGDPLVIFRGNENGKYHQSAYRRNRPKNKCFNC